MTRDAHLGRLNIFKLPIDCASMPRSSIYRLRCLDIMTGAIVDRNHASSPLLADPFLPPILLIHNSDSASRPFLDLLLV